jgi:repressor LexA
MVTPRQRQIFDYLCRYADAHGYAPTMAEIGKQFKLSSPASVHHILSGLEREGLINGIERQPRIEVVRDEESEQGNEIPLLGVVALVNPSRPSEATKRCPCRVISWAASDCLRFGCGEIR